MVLPEEYEYDESLWELLGDLEKIKLGNGEGLELESGSGSDATADSGDNSSANTSATMCDEWV